MGTFDSRDDDKHTHTHIIILYYTYDYNCVRITNYYMRNSLIRSLCKLLNFLENVSDKTSL